MEITDKVKQKDNFLVVKVNNTRTTDAIRYCRSMHKGQYQYLPAKEGAEVHGVLDRFRRSLPGVNADGTPAHPNRDVYKRQVMNSGYNSHFADHCFQQSRE